MKLYSKVLAALLSASLAAQLVAPAYAYNVSSNTSSATNITSTGGQIVVNNQDGTQQVLTQEDLENGTNLPEGIVIENGTNTPAPTTPSPEVSQAPAQESEAPQESEEPAQESEAPVQESPAPTQESGETGSDRIDMNLPVVSPSTGNSSDGSVTQQETPLAVYWNPGSGYGVDESKMSVVFPQQQSQKNILQQGLSWLSSLVSGVFGGGSKTVQLPAGKDSNSGRSPMAPVKTFEAAMEQAQALADEQGVDVRDVTIYSMNPQEVLDGETLEVSGADLTVQAWEGRNYDSDVLFYVNNGTLTMEGVNLLARDEENEEESAQTLVQVFDGSVVMGASVAVNGGFTLDFSPSESEKLWDEDSALTDEKVGSPVIELTEDFQPDSNGYSITVLGQSEEGQRQEVVRTSGMTDAQVQSYAGSFALTGEDSQGLSLEVDQQDQNQSATTVDSGAAPASLSLYAVRATGTTVYWNPGGSFWFNGVEYLAGNDESNTGTDEKRPLKTFNTALNIANGGKIVCMRPIIVDESTFTTLSDYLTVDGNTIQLHGDGNGDNPVVLTNWLQGLPIMEISGDYTLSLANVQLSGYQNANNLVTVGKGATVTMGTKATVTTGSYIQVEFAEGAPNPIQVSSEDASATIFASGILYASHYEGTKLVQATKTLVTNSFNGSKDAAGKHLLDKFGLSTQNTSPSTSGTDKPVKWSLVQNIQLDQQDSLVLEAEKTYKTIYIDPDRGSDEYHGLSCLYPVKTMERALEVLDQGIKEVLPLRKANQGTMTAEQLEEEYPLPGHLVACSTIKITDQQEWNWARSGDEWTDYTGTIVTPYLTAHEEGETGTDGDSVHGAPEYVIRVDAGGSLTLKDVRIYRELSAAVEMEQWKLINVVNSGTLVLEGSTELYTQNKNATEAVPAYMGVGIVAGRANALDFTSGGMDMNDATAATITMGADWTGSIHGLSRGVVLMGKDTSMTMAAGSITDNRNNEVGAGVSVFYGATFIMNGGTISNNQAAAGAGVLVASHYTSQDLSTGYTSKFTMVQGRIEGNTMDMDVYGSAGFEGIGGAGVLSYFGFVELGEANGDDALCYIGNNTLARSGNSSRTVTTSNGVGVSIYGQNKWDEKAFVMHSGTIAGNKVKDEASVTEQAELSINGIGLSLAGLMGATIEGATIRDNTVDTYFQMGTGHIELQGGGMYVKTGGVVEGKELDENGASLTFQGLEVTGNQLNATGFAGVSSGWCTVRGGGIFFDTSDNVNVKPNVSVLLSDSKIINNQVGVGREAYTWNMYAYGGGIYSNLYLRMDSIEVSENKAGDAESYDGKGGGIYGSALWANKVSIKDNEAKYTGGGWYNIMKPETTNYDWGIKYSVIQDCTITGNKTITDGPNYNEGDGGGIAFIGFGYKYSCTLTETFSGGMQITKNHAAATGGGVCTANSGTLIFDFDSTWENTADNGVANLLSYTRSKGDLGATYLLKGTFVGSNSVQAVGETDRNDLYLDPTQATFQVSNQGDTAITLTDPGTVVSLLDLGDATHPLAIKIDPNQFGAGNVVVRPANMDKVPVGVLKENEAQLGGHEIGSVDREYTLTTDVSKDSAGRDASSYITVTGLPLRTQLTAVPEGGLTSLGLVAEGVYLDGVNGEDENDGLSTQTAVKTWEQAVKLLTEYSAQPPTEDQKTTGFQPIIWVCGTVSLSDEVPLTLPQSVVSQTYKDFEETAKRTPERAVFRRFGTFQDGPMFQVTDGAVNVTYVRIDGNSGALASPGKTCHNIQVTQSATLNVGDGARIYNGYASCVYLQDSATLNVAQSFTPDQTDSVNDEQYGIQIDSNPQKYVNRWFAVAIGPNNVVNLNENAYLGSSELIFSYSYALGFYGAGTLKMNDNSLVSASYPMCLEAKANITMNGHSRVEGGYEIVSCLDGSDWATLTMNGNSSLARGLGSTTASLGTGLFSNLSILMLDQSRIECPIVSDVSPGYQSEDAGLKLVMGREDGTDSPQIIVPLDASADYPGSIQLGGGHIYLEMNANSTVKGTIYIWGMYAGGDTLVGEIPEFGLVMRDEATLTAAEGNPAAVVLTRGERNYNYSTTYFNDWDGTVPFSIVVEEDAKIIGDIRGDFNYEADPPTQDENVMGDGQHITLRGSAQVQGTIGDKKIDYSISKVVLEDSAKVVASAGMTAQDRVVKARQVTLKGNASVSASTSSTAGTQDPQVYGENASVYALEGMTLDIAATVGGPILLGSTASITLTNGMPDPAEAKDFMLHLSAAHMGQVVVKPDGSTVTDATVYLSNFTKTASQGEAADVDLGTSGVNIILNRIWNVYLSSNGNDNNDGSSPENAVRTFKQAKHLLTTVEGYGPTGNNGSGSNIIIPDSVTILPDDHDWSFDKGGTVTNNDKTWTPLVTRSTTTVYDEPLIVINNSSFYYDQTEPVVFRNITLDAGGANVQFALDTTTGWLKHQNSLLVVNGESFGDKKRTVELGEGAVLQNLQYDMASKDTGLTQLTAGEYAGGYAVNVYRGNLVMDGCVIENFHVKNFNYDGGSTGTSANNSASIVHVTGGGSLQFKSGTIRNNSVNVASFRSDSNYGGVGILLVTGGANFIMSGGEISGNVVSGNADKLNRTMSNAVLQTGILVLDPVGYEATAEISGGTIQNNENQLRATDETSEVRYTEGIICVGSRFQAQDSTQPTIKLTISGGSITDNQARRGSAFTLACGTVILAGGTIQNNRSVAEVGSDGWQAEYSPIFIGGTVPNYQGKGLQQLVLQGDGCKFDSPIYLPSGRQITVSGQLRDTNRVYEIYQGDSNLVQGSAVVVPDANNISDVTPYLQNFRVYAKGMVLDRGRVDQQITVQQGTRNEQKCLVLMKAVFVDSLNGTDPKDVNIFDPQYDRGRRPDEPVKTLDAARAIGQAFCEMDDGVYENSNDHKKHKDYYVIYAVGPVYETLYEGTVTDGHFVDYTKNEDSKNFQFTLGGASYLTRYTGWELYVGNGQVVSGEHYYGNLIEVNGAATFQNITVQGRREIDSVDKNGETLVVVNSGATLNIQEGTKLTLNNATGTRPDPDVSGGTQPIDTRGGAIRVAPGGTLNMSGGTIDSSCTAVTGDSIYLEGKQDTLDAAQLTMQNQVTVGGEIYLGGAQNDDAPILVDQSFAPNGSILIGMQSDYDKKKVVQWTNGAPITEEKLEWFTYSNSVSALYDTEIVSSSESGTLDTIVLDLREIVYLNPDGGDDTNSGKTPGDAVATLDRIYEMYRDREDIPGVLVFVMNPITVGNGKQLVISNGQLKQNGVTKHISVYSENTWTVNPDISASIVEADNEKTMNCEIYFRRYVKTSDQDPPTGYNVDSYLGELFVVENGGMLQLNGVYLDGQSIGIQTNNPALSSVGAIAEAPLVRVDGGGLAQFLTGTLMNHKEGNDNYRAESAMLTNNTNNKAKDKVLDGTDNITEGSSAGIEILSSGTGTGWANEQRGKVVLQGTKLDNLKLEAKNSGKAIIGGSDIYQNGELWVSLKTRFGGSVFLEGNGRSGNDAELSRESSRWISVSAYGNPVETAFKVTVRDPYQNRRVVVYPYADKTNEPNADNIEASEIGLYMLTEEATRYYILEREQVEPDQAVALFNGKGENTLWMRVPPAVYIDPVNGNDTTGDGRYPETAVQSLSRAIECMTGLSSKVLYVLNPIPITEMSYLYPTGYTHDGTVVALPNQNLQLTIRRYVQPDAPGTNEYYQVESYTGGALFDIQSGGSLILEGSVILDGASQGQTGPEVPADQTYAQGIQVTAPLVTVQQGGTLELRSDGEGEEVTRPTLTNNDNTGDGNHVAGGAINNAGNVILDGGVLTDNQGSAGQGKAEGIYQAGNLTIRSYPQGLGDQTVYLAEDRVITVEELIQTMVGESGEKFTIRVDMDNAAAGRDVVTYTSVSNVDAESGWYSLGSSVPGSLFLVQAADDANTLELQDWQQLKVTVPEEVFLVVYEAGANGAQVGKGDVSTYGYGVPEYTITNGGTRDVRVSVNGFEVGQTQSGKDGFSLVASEDGLIGDGALLYLALTAPTGATLESNKFAELAERSLALSNGNNIELGTLQPDQSGSFVFTGSANQALLDLWMDSEFPATTTAEGGLAEARKNYMRTKNAETGETSLANAAAQFKLTYRIELA